MYIYILLLVLFSKNSHAQHREIYTQYAITPYLINPAAAAMDVKVATISCYARKQWIGVYDAPQSLHIQASTYLNNFNSGLGLHLTADKLGPMRQYQSQVTYNYQLFLDELRNGRLCIGLGAIIEMQGYDFGTITDLGLLSDDAIYTNNQNRTRFDIDAGVLYKSDMYALGIALENILQRSFNYQRKDSIYDKYKVPIHFNAYGRMIFKSSNEIFQFMPAFLIKYEKNLPYQFDFSVIAEWKKMISLGLNFRKDDAISALVGIRPRPWVHLGYAFDYTFSTLKLSSNGSHELGLTFFINKD